MPNPGHAACKPSRYWRAWAATRTINQLTGAYQAAKANEPTLTWDRLLRRMAGTVGKVERARARAAGIDLSALGVTSPAPAPKFDGPPKTGRTIRRG